MFARGVDGAGNSGGKDIVLTGTGTVSDGTSPTVWTTGATGFSTFMENNAAGDGPISNGTGTGARSFTLKAQVVGAGVGVGVPFSTVCWYYQDLASATNPNGTGDYVQIRCQNLAVSTLVAGTYTWDWTGPTFDPPANLGTGVTALNIIAIGMGNGGSASGRT